MIMRRWVPAGAYRQLAEEGWLDLRQGMGATVVERPAPTPSPRAGLSTLDF